MTIEALLYIVICIIGAVAVYGGCYAIAHMGGWTHLFGPDENPHDDLAACCSCGLLLPVSSWRLRGGLCAECEGFWGWPEEQRWWHEFCYDHVPRKVPDFPSLYVDELQDAGPGVIRYASIFVIWLEQMPFIREHINTDFVRLQVKLSGAWQYFREVMIEDQGKLDWER